MLPNRTPPVSAISRRLIARPRRAPRSTITVVATVANMAPPNPCNASDAEDDTTGRRERRHDVTTSDHGKAGDHQWSAAQAVKEVACREVGVTTMTLRSG